MQSSGWESESRSTCSFLVFLVRISAQLLMAQIRRSGVVNNERTKRWVEGRRPSRIAPAMLSCTTPACHLGGWEAEVLDVVAVHRTDGEEEHLQVHPGVVGVRKSEHVVRV